MRLQLMIRHSKSFVCWNFNKTLWIVRDSPTLVVQASSFVLKVWTLCVDSKPKQEIQIVRAHTILACIRNRSSLATFRNMADVSLLAKCVHGCTQNLNENLSYCMPDKHQKLYFSVYVKLIESTITHGSIHCWRWSVSQCFNCIVLNWCLGCSHILVRKLVRPWPEMRLLTMLVVMLISRLYLALC